MLEVLRETGQKGVVADITSEVCYSQRVQWHTLEDCKPRHSQRPLKHNRKTQLPQQRPM